jgi:hypothetical protein
MSPDFHNGLIKFFLLTVLFGIWVLALVRSRIETLGLALWLVFLAFALHSTRNIPLFAVVCTPWLATWSDALLRQAEPKSSWVRKFQGWSVNVDRTVASLPGWPAALLIAVVLSRAALVRGSEGEFAFDPEVFPVEAVAELRGSGFVPPGPIFNDFIWGGYLLYAWPGVPVFIDGQTDFYGEKLTREYQQLRSVAPGWRDVLDRHGVRWVLVRPDAPLSTALELTGEWHAVYEDSTAIAWVVDSVSVSP